MDSILAQQLANGIVLGSVYALIALGYTMVYGILGLINFAHGEVTMMGAMLSITFLNILLGIPNVSPLLCIAAALLLSIPACMLLGVGIERIAYRPLRNAPRLAPLITAIGVSIVLQNVAMMVWGRGYQRFPDVLPSEPITLLGASLTPAKLIIIAVSIIVLVGLWLLINRTRLGRAMRATAQDGQVARLMGVSVDNVVAATFAIGSALGSLAGFLVAATYGQADPYMGFMLGLKAFSAAVLGGIGNLTGAVVGGLLLGVIESLGAGYIGELTGGVLGSNYQDVFAFLVLVAVLVFKPSGLLGKTTVERA